MAFVSLTRLHLRAWYHFLAFGVHAQRAARQAERSPGFLGGALSGDLRRRTFWTATIWSDEAAMRAYLVTGAHRVVMPKIGTWCDESAVARIENADARVPTAEEALEHMRKHGRPVRLSRPSPAHAAGATVPDGRPPRFAQTLRPVQGPQ